MTTQLRCSCDGHALLLRFELASGLHAQRCEVCDGVLVSMADYRQWRERAPQTPELTLPAPDIADSPSARTCMSCSHLMHRYRVGVKPDFRVDHCPVCQLLWLDKGEWAALSQAGLATRLSDIVSDAWQRRVQGDELRARREAGLRSKHGDACIDEVKRIREWLDSQPQREEVIALLRAGW